MRVLVTGGRGLLGSAVVRELLTRGDQVSVFQRSAAGLPPQVREFRGDVTDPGALAAAMAGQQGVIHLAARVSMVGPWADFERVNVTGTVNVLAQAAVAGVERLVHVSSPSVAHAGEPLVAAPAARAEPARTRGHYARSKAFAELAALAADGPTMAVTAIRPHLVWGPGDTQLVGRIAQRARAGRLVLVDDGAALIDSTYVDNAASALCQALARCTDPQVRGRPFVVSNGQPRTVFELVGRIALAAGGRPPRIHVPYPVARGAGAVIERAWLRSGRPDEPPLTAFVAEQLATAHWFDQRQTRSALHWHPAVGIDEGLARLAAAFQAA